MDAILGQVAELELENLADSQKARAVAEQIRAFHNDPSTSDADDDAIFAIHVMNSIDMMYWQYRNLFPKYRPMGEMKNQLAKIVPAGMKVIFGEDLPSQVREAFPHFSIIFEENRANSFI